MTEHSLDSSIIAPNKPIPRSRDRTESNLAGDVMEATEKVMVPPGSTYDVAQNPFLEVY